ncbi:MAG: RrF2 family transcriptional regulator [Sediminispirochaetaceae bacterium]
MKYSTRTRYGLRFLVYLAMYGRDRYVQLSEVERHEEISLRYLEQIIRMLKPTGILVSQRGKYGGYQLAKQPEEIVMADIVENLEGDLAPIACLGPNRECARHVDCPTLPMWKELQEVLLSYLRKKTLQDIVDQYRATAAEGGRVVPVK